MTPNTLPPLASTVSLPPIPAVVAKSPLRLTAEDFFARYENARVELVEGLVQEMPMPGFEHGEVAMNFAFVLKGYVSEREVGRVFINDTFILLKRDPDFVRGPDVGYVSFERLPREQKPKGMLTVIPELVVEVRSPTDSWTGVFAKVVDYLQAGVNVVIVLDAETQTASIYRPETLQQTLTADAELSLPELFPEFRVRVGQLFEV